jgi:hypothetical protein
VPARKTVLGLVLRAAAMAALAGVLMRLFGIASRARVGAKGEVGRPARFAELFTAHGAPAKTAISYGP